MAAQSPDESQDRPPAVGEERVVYVWPRGQDSEWGDDFDLRALWGVVRERWKIIALATVLCGLAGVAYSLTATERFRAESVIIPAESRNSRGLASQFGGLASLAGFNLSSDDRTEPLAVLKSRSFARSFIQDQDLVGVLTAGSSRVPWMTDVEERPRAELVEEAVDYFDGQIRTVTEDRKTGIVTVTVEWKDPKIASAWANALVDRLNEQMRDRAIREASANAEYLRSELVSTSLVSLQQSIGRLLEGELQTIMLAKGNREYSYRIVDRATPPTRRYWPRRKLIVLLSLISGFILGVAGVAMHRALAGSGAGK